MPPAVLTGRRERQDNGKRGIWRCVHTSGTVIFAHVPTTLIYVVAATIVDGGPTPIALHRPFLALLPPPVLSARIIGRQRAFTVGVYQWSAQRKIHETAMMAGRAPRKMVWGPRDNARDIKTCVKLSHLWEPRGTHRPCWMGRNNLLFIDGLNSDLSRRNWSRALKIENVFRRMRL